MTFQPPPPPPPPPQGPPNPPPPPPGQWEPPSGQGPSGGGSLDPKSVNQFDWALMGIGAILFIFSFFDYYSFSYGPFSASYSAWHTAGGTWLAWFAMIIGVAAAGVVALAIFMPDLKLPMSNRALGVVLFGASTVLYVIAIFAHDDFGPNGGHGFSFWLSLILVAAGTVLSLQRAQQTNTTLPGPLNNLPKIGK
jgi:hypothetical protein